MNFKILPLGGALLGLLLMAAQPTPAQGLTFTTNTYSVGSSPVSVAAAIINGSGTQGLISANYNANTLTVLTNNGNGVFGFNATLPVGTNPVFVVAASLNTTSLPALFCANSTSGNAMVLTNNGAGVYGSNATLFAYGNPDCLAVADIYGTGKPALICANNDGTLIVFTNTGSGFSPIGSLGPGSGQEYVVAADVNGDGHPDLITANYTDSSLTVMTNNGAGGFSAMADYNVGTNPVCVAAADVNGDGKVDLVSANYNSQSLTVLTNNGIGVFGSNATINLSGSPTSLVLTNLTASGKPDLAVTVSGLVNSIQVFTNNGSGLFGSNTTIYLPPQNSIVAAQVNNPGLNDLITANKAASELTVLTQSGTGRPVLRITRPAVNSIVVTWVSAFTNFILQTNSSLATTNWTSVSLSGTNQSATVSPPPKGNLFFRLHN